MKLQRALRLLLALSLCSTVGAGFGCTIGDSFWPRRGQVWSHGSWGTFCTYLAARIFTGNQIGTTLRLGLSSTDC